MIELTFADELRLKASVISGEAELKEWWAIIAPKLITASESGAFLYKIYERLSGAQIDFCIAKGLQVTKTPRHVLAGLEGTPWYILSWGVK